jgi:hypothetical protein
MNDCVAQCRSLSQFAECYGALKIGVLQNQIEHQAGRETGLLDAAGLGWLEKRIFLCRHVFEKVNAANVGLVGSLMHKIG